MERIISTCNEQLKVPSQAPAVAIVLRGDNNGNVIVLPAVHRLMQRMFERCVCEGVPSSRNR